MKIQLVSIWTIILSGVRKVGRHIRVFSQKVGKSLGAGFSWFKNHWLPAVGHFFVRHIRQAKTDIGQLALKMKGPAKARSKQTQSTKVKKNQTDDFATSSRHVSPGMRQKISRIKPSHVVASLKAFREKDQISKNMSDQDNEEDIKIYEHDFLMSEEQSEITQENKNKNKVAQEKSESSQATIGFKTLDNQTNSADLKTKRLDIKAALAEDDEATDLMLVPQQKTSLPAIVGKKKKKVPPIRRKSRQRVYRLVGYTTVAKVNRKHKAEMQQQFLRKFLIYVAVILMIVVLFKVYNPFRDLTELYRILGISDLSEFAQNSPLMPDATPTPRG